MLRQDSFLLILTQPSLSSIVCRVSSAVARAQTAERRANDAEAAMKEAQASSDTMRANLDKLKTWRGALEDAGQKMLQLQEEKKTLAREVEKAFAAATDAQKSAATHRDEVREPANSSQAPATA